MDPNDEARIPVGYVRRAHGINGDVVVRPLTDDPDRFAPDRGFSTDEDPPRRLVVDHSQAHKDGLLVGFSGFADRSAAETLQGITLTITAAERRDLEHDEFWPEQLQGLMVIDPSGKHLGRVTGVVLSASQDRLVVDTGDGDLVEVPFVEAMVGDVHPSLGHVVVDPPPGLFDDDFV